MPKPKTTDSRPIPRVLWSKYAYRPYDGPVTQGFREGAGFIDEALRIAQRPNKFLDIDLEKAARVLKAMRHPKLSRQADHCTNEIEARQQQGGRDQR